MSKVSVYDIVRKHGGTVHQGISWDSFWFKGDEHKDRSIKAYKECEDNGYYVYNLLHIKGWQDEHNKVEEHSMFNHK